MHTRLYGWSHLTRGPQLHGWATPFREVRWNHIAGHFHEYAARERGFRHMADLVDSILARGGAAQLAGLTSMYDLLVTPRPVPETAPVQVVAVRTAPGANGVLIEHLSYTGHDDRIHCRPAETVPLFWRFMSEKFGVRPAPLSPGTGRSSAAAGPSGG
ncbi:hypothetical protein M8C13_13930 [Crossiella sp. SN42]|uniref:hypothetical protein n=1 Tax=Crossiella sp. SN42 TaxID=2944808 RepID=UPI00207C72F7|nr:hypothetical protein [Crossiella sp. SN42]MCO1576853.1 hypothetical protein [Crossiella sp. SN42]